ncbi:MAG TPA: CZB domain-containing protein [Lachnospiraceae bacterium]|nr:CZB domain-containing protein [Lachnospiraceae bacterium]
MSIFKSLRSKLIASISGSFLIVVAMILTICIISLNNYFSAENTTQLNTYTASFNTLLENYKTQALAQGENIAVNPDIIEGVANRDFDFLLEVSAPLMEKGKLDYMVFTDPDGYIILRTHKPDAVPTENDSIAGQINVASAMKGTSCVWIEPGKVVKLSVRAGVQVIQKMLTVASNAHEVAAATEEISASMEEVTKHSVNTNELADHLQERIDTFSLRDDSTRSDAEIIEQVKSDHYIFVVMLGNMLKGLQTVTADSISTDHSCRFGKWYFTADNPYRDYKVYKDIETPHRKLHEYAQKTVSLYEKGNLVGAKAAYNNVQKYSHQVVGILNKLEKSTAKANTAHSE